MLFRARPEYRYLVIGLLGCVAYVVTASNTVGEVIYVALACSVPAAGYFGTRYLQPRPPAGWMLLTVGFGVVAVTELLLCIANAVFGFERSLKVLTFGFLLGYAIQLVALFQIVQARSAGRNSRAWLDSLAVAATVSSAVWLSLYRPLQDAGVSSFLDWFRVLGVAVLGAGLIVMGCRLLFGEGRTGLGFGMLVAGYAFQSIADISGNFLTQYQYGSRLRVASAIAYVCMGTAVLYPRRQVARPQRSLGALQREARQVCTGQAVLAVLLVTTFAIKAIGALPLVVVVVVCVAAAVLLLAFRARTHSLLNHLANAATNEGQLRLAALVGTAHEAVLLLDPNGIVRYLSPAFNSLFHNNSPLKIDAHIGDIVAHQYPQLQHLADKVRGSAPGTETTWEGPILKADGTNRTLQITAKNYVETPGVHGYVYTLLDVTERSQLLEELRFQAFHDPLTGLATRARLSDLTSEAIADAEGSSRMPMLAVLDLDDFKGVNDSLGHDLGDELLRAVAHRLLESVPVDTVVARLGGDEFAIMMCVENESLAQHQAQFIADHLSAQPLHAGGGSFALRASVGVAVYRYGDDSAEMLRRADIALHEAKRDGKSRVKVFREQMQLTAQAELEFRSDLAQALRNGELSLVYQPVVSISAGIVCGVEALLRWNHPVRGEVSSQAFVHIAEQHGFVSDIGQWALRTACQQAVSWVDAEHLYLSVNISAAQITDPRLVGAVRNALEESGLAPFRLVLEVTETMFVGDNSTALKVIEELRLLGVRFALDDFGAGHCSLALLQQMCIDILKIDRSFVTDVANRPQQRALVMMLLQLAKNLGLSAVGEGAETAAEVEALREMGCDLVQGYWFSQPLSAGRLNCFLAARHRSAIGA